ncbi:filamentous hemagglutinin N-terminal domain-containing protein [Limnohabitans sp. Hippo3]|uniref:two-partner secretion domain-containing protein n=1 Tax=Limnohabitans sp. Hippo3 TaxID=1597956 RepID=UPI000D397E80|nr:filamentous hemagglutinin N-terminal domain-containing protein [Limnohabitans sp. Hippo3]PUE43375.1 hypothetical protein B9Z34_00570 [Limnohabitans sp. Hippo3]
MNARSYKTVFSKRLGALVAVGEHATSQGKANGAGSGGGAASGASSTIGYIAALTASFAFVSLAWAAPATNALPTGGNVVQGAASMAQSANQLNITQSTQRAAINWQSFDIGAAAKVNVAQPNAQAVLLNRVVGQSPSQIFGKLQANGHVILVNPNGVLFGKDGSVNAGGFTASTLNITDANFMAGNMVYERNGSTAGIVNQGSITAAPGGYVALLGATVSNEGSIHTQGGSVVMGAGETIKVPVSGTGRIKLELTPAAINASLSNTGSIVTEGGQVYMQALALNRAAAQILQSGSIDTTGDKGGNVHLLADGGQIRVSGSIKANSTNGTAGGDIYIGRDKDTNMLAAVGDVSGAMLESKGGFVETSGHELTVDNTQVLAGTWLLDPDNIDITNAATATAGYSKVSAANVSSALNAGANVVIHTTNGVNTSAGSVPYTATNPTGEGNILVSSAISKTSGGNASLTITADNGLTVNAAITASGVGTGTLDINLTANGLTNGTAVGSMTTTERALSRGLLINGVALNANGGDITLTGTSYASASSNANANATNAVGKGVQIHNGASLTARDITISGTAENQSGQVSNGVLIQRYPSASTFTASRNIAITGTLQGAGSGAAIDIRESGWGSQSITMNAGGTITLRGNNRASTSNPSQAIYIGAGLQARAVGNITVQAETNNANVNAISFFSSATTTNGGLNGNVSLRSIDANGNATGDVLIQANQGGITFNNQLPSASSATAIVGRNITIDNTGGTVDANTGAITAGTGRSESAVGGVNLADGRSLSASGNINILGVTNANNQWGVMLSGPLSANTMNVVGRHTNGAAGGGGMYIRSGTSLTTRSGDSLVQGVMPSVVASSALVLGDSATSTVTLNATNGSRIKLQGDATGAAVFNSAQVSTGILAQGTVNSTGNIELQGSSGSTTGLNLNAAVNHSGGTLTLSGTSSPDGVADGYSTHGVLVQKAVTVTDNSELNITGAYVGRGSLSTASSTILSGVTVSSTLTGNGGALNITGTSSLPSAIAANARGVAITGAVSGWGNTTVTGQAAGSSIGPSIVLTSNVNVGSSKLQLLANGGQINQSSASTITAGAVVIDNTGAGRNSLFTDNSVSSNLALGTSYGGSIAADGTIVAGNGVANTHNGVDLSGIFNISGDVNIAGTTASTTAGRAGVRSSGTVNGRNITMVANATASTGSVLGYYGAGGRFIASEKLNLTGISSNAGNGLYSYGGRYESGTGMTLVGISAQGNAMGMDANLAVVNGSAGGISITATATDPTKNALSLNGASLTSSGGDIVLNAASGHVTVGTGNPVWGLGTLSNTITSNGSGAIQIKAASSTPSTSDIGSIDGTTLSIVQNGNGGVEVSTSGQGNVIAPKITNAGTGAVVVAAGSAIDAGDGSGGQVKTVAGNAITQTSTGKTYIFSGSASATDALTNLDVSFSELRLSGDMGSAQNADSNVKYAAGTSISAGASAQVMFREKVVLDASSISGKVLKTYGDANTTSSTSDQAGLLAEMKSALKTANTGTITQVTGSANFKISKAALIDDLSGALSGATRSASDHLRAVTHNYGALTAGKYTATVSAGQAQVEVGKRALSGSIVQGNTTYGEALVAGAVNLTNIVTGDAVHANDVIFTTTGLTSNSGNLKAGTHVDVQTVSGLSGADSDNYTFADVKGSYKVDQKSLVIGGITANDKVYNGDAVAAVNTAGVTKVGLVGADVVTLNVSGTFRNDTNTADDKNVKLVAGVVAAKTVALNSTYGGADRDNYLITDQTTTSAVIAQRALTIDVGTVATKTIDGTTTATVTPGALNNLVAGESLGVLAVANFSDPNVGTAKVVTASYTLQNGTNGLASNYILNAATPNPDSRLRGNIVSSVNPIVNPSPLPVNNNTTSRVSTVTGSGSSGAATGVLDDQPLSQTQEVCSDLTPENCECQASVIPSIEICFAPKSVAATKEEK